MLSAYHNSLGGTIMTRLSRLGARVWYPCTRTGTHAGGQVGGRSRGEAGREKPGGGAPAPGWRRTPPPTGLSPLPAPFPSASPAAPQPPRRSTPPPSPPARRWPRSAAGGGPQTSRPGCPWLPDRGPRLCRPGSADRLSGSMFGVARPLVAGHAQCIASVPAWRPPRLLPGR